MNYEYDCDILIYIVIMNEQWIKVMDDNYSR